MDDLGEKLKNVLSDKDSFAQIMNLAKTLGGGTPALSPPPESGDESAPAASGFSSITSLLDMPQIKNLFVKGQSDRLNLLRALKPYLKEEKRPKIDKIANAISTIDTLYAAKDLI